MQDGGGKEGGGRIRREVKEEAEVWPKREGRERGGVRIWLLVRDAAYGVPTPASRRRRGFECQADRACAAPARARRSRCNPWRVEGTPPACPIQVRTSSPRRAAHAGGPWKCRGQRRRPGESAVGCQIEGSPPACPIQVERRRPEASARAQLAARLPSSERSRGSWWNCAEVSCLASCTPPVTLGESKALPRRARFK